MLEGAVRLVADNTHTSHFVAALKRKPHARVWGYVYGGLAWFDSTLSAYNHTGEARLTNSGLPRRAIVRVKNYTIDNGSAVEKNFMAQRAWTVAASPMNRKQPGPLQTVQLIWHQHDIRFANRHAPRRSCQRNWRQQFKSPGDNFADTEGAGPCCVHSNHVRNRVIQNQASNDTDAMISNCGYRPKRGSAVS